MQVPSMTALAAARLGLSQATARFDRAAAVIAAAGLDTSPGGTAAAPAADAGAALDMTGAMLEMLLAQRAFAAQLRVIDSADAMLRETLGLGR